MNEATRTWAPLFLGLVVLGCGASGSGGQGEPGGEQAAISSGDEGVSASGPNSVVRKSGSGSVTARLGTPGGMLELNEGPRVEVPPGSIEEGTDFVLKVAQVTTAFGNKESEKAVGPTFSFAPGVDAPDGRSVTVSLPMPSIPDGWGEPALAFEVNLGSISYGEDSTRTKWQYEPAKLSGGRIVAEMPSLDGLRMQFVLSNLEAQ